MDDGGYGSVGSEPIGMRIAHSGADGDYTLRTLVLLQRGGAGRSGRPALLPRRARARRRDALAAGHAAVGRGGGRPQFRVAPALDVARQAGPGPLRDRRPVCPLSGAERRDLTGGQLGRDGGPRGFGRDGAGSGGRLRDPRGVPGELRGQRGAGLRPDNPGSQHRSGSVLRGPPGRLRRHLPAAARTRRRTGRIRGGGLDAVRVRGRRAIPFGRRRGPALLRA